ncbi:hypothetical protein acdb102_30980 [Acidothermaceae bacterium B102]|nr:hypothetical protein acdb102_30980 [Acidothermaceae bacterium B102]
MATAEAPWDEQAEIAKVAARAQSDGADLVRFVGIGPLGDMRVSIGAHYRELLPVSNSGPQGKP